MFKRGHINYPSNKKELSKVTTENAMAIIDTNFRAIEHGMKLLSSMLGIENVAEMVRNMPPMTFTTKLNGNRKIVTSVEEVVQILRAMMVKCEKPSCMILLDAGRKEKNGLIKDFQSIDCDDIETNKKMGIYVYYTNDGRYNILYTEG